MQYLMTVTVCAQRHLTYMYMADDVLTYDTWNMFKNRVKCTQYETCAELNGYRLVDKSLSCPRIGWFNKLYTQKSGQALNLPTDWLIR